MGFRSQMTVLLVACLSACAPPSLKSLMTPIQAPGPQPSPDPSGPAGAAFAPCPAPPRSYSRTLVATSAAELRTMITSAQPGDDIAIAPGVYALGSKLNIRQDAIRVRSRDGLGTVTLQLQDGPFVMFDVEASQIEISDLNLEGVCTSDDRCAHAVQVKGKSTGHASGFRFMHNEVKNFDAAIKHNLQSTTNRYFQDDIHILHNHFFNTSPRQTSSPVVALNIDGGERTWACGNLIENLGKAGGNGITYHAFFKSNNRHSTFERNYIRCNPSGFTGAGEVARLGFSLGGGLSNPATICDPRESPLDDCSAEAQDALVANNIITDCNDKGLALNKAASSRVYYNTLLGTTGMDARFTTTMVDSKNNLGMGSRSVRDGGQYSTGAAADLLGGSSSDVAATFPEWVDRGSLSAAIDTFKGNFFIGSSQAGTGVLNDFCGRARLTEGADWGAIEYPDSERSSPCIDDPRGAIEAAIRIPARFP